MAVQVPKIQPKNFSSSSSSGALANGEKKLEDRNLPQNRGNNSGDEAEEKNRIFSTPEIILMVAIALIFDLLSLIPIVNMGTSLISQIIFALWFIMHRISFLNNKKMLATLLTVFGVELIPVVSALPAITIGLILNIVFAEKGNLPIGNLVPIGGKATQITKNIIGSSNSSASSIDMPEDEIYAEAA